MSVTVDHAFEARAPEYKLASVSMMLSPDGGLGTPGMDSQTRALELESFFKDGIALDDEMEGGGNDNNNDSNDDGNDSPSRRSVGSRSGKSSKSFKGRKNLPGQAGGSQGSQRGGGGIQLRRETIARVQGGVTYQVKADDDDLDELYEAELESASKSALTMSTQVNLLTHPLHTAP